MAGSFFFLKDQGVRGGAAEAVQNPGSDGSGHGVECRVLSRNLLRM